LLHKCKTDKRKKGAVRKLRGVIWGNHILKIDSFLHGFHHRGHGILRPMQIIGL